MVGYDDTNDALTLGDDDVLEVGDYEIKYNSTSGDWEAVYTPTGDVANVPTSQSGSLFPTDFADAMAGKALSDDGNVYDSVQDAENAANNWVFVGPGTFSEYVGVDTQGLTLTGCGYNTHIDGGSTQAIEISASDVTISNLSVSTTAGGQNSVDGVKTTSGAGRTTIRGVTVRNTDRHGFNIGQGTGNSVVDCRVESADNNGVRISNSRATVRGCHIRNVGTHGIYGGRPEDAMIVNNAILSPGSRGIYLNNSGGDCIVGGNRIQGAGSTGILLNDGIPDCIVFNNRISDSGTSDINDSGSGTVIDANITGASN